MQYDPPSEEDARRILAEHVHRWPMKASITVGAVRLPLIIGNPSGAARVKSPTASPAWADAIAVTLSLARADDTQANQLGADCVLWPPLPTFNEWCERWPALPDRVASLARQKFGGDLGCISEPAYDAKPPEPVALALIASAAAVHRIARVEGARLDLVLVPPTRGAWDTFTAAIRKPDADRWRLCSDMVAGCVPCALADGVPIDPAAMLDRWCGLGVVLVAAISQLAGAGAEAHLGEW